MWSAPGSMGLGNSESSFRTPLLIRVEWTGGSEINSLS